MSTVKGEDWLGVGGEAEGISGWLATKVGMGKSIAEFDWETTPLGRLNYWPHHLRAAVNLMIKAACPMAVVWGKEFRFIYNDRYAEALQHKHPAALGERAEFIFPESWPILKPLFERALNGEAVALADQEMPVHRNGRTDRACYSLSYNPITSDRGNVEGFLAVIMETPGDFILEREQAQVAATLLSTISDFAYTFDLDGRFVYANKALLDLWGLKLEEAVGRNFYDLKYPAELAEHLQGQIQEVIDKKTVVRDETRYVSPSGEEGYYEYIFSGVLSSDGSVYLVAGSTRDITARKRLEIAALAESAAKDNFLATLSHELRTPLNPVLLLATEGAANEDLPPEVREDFQSISQNIALEAQLIDDLLDLSRIAHGKLTLELKTQDIHSILARVIGSVEPEAIGKRLSVVRQFDALRWLVKGDELRLHQIFWNLLRNAVKFTPPDGTITIATHDDPSAADKIVIEITDTGIGLSGGEAAKIFEPFSQGDHTVDSAGKFGGLGLGLTIARKVAEMHSGSISARSLGREKGATFVVELPVEPWGSASPIPAPLIPRFFGQGPGATRLRVLLVEDHAASRQALARLLSHREIEVFEAASANAALAIAASHAFDIVISDIGLPDISGYELMRSLAKTYGCLGIALSGYGSEHDIKLSNEAGFSIHLTKPIESRTLDEALERLSKSRRP